MDWRVGNADMESHVKIMIIMISINAKNNRKISVIVVKLIMLYDK